MIDHSDEVGWPAETARTRSVPTALSGQPQYGKPAHNAKPPTGEIGWLTPVRKSKGDPSTWFWRCRCGDDKVLKRVNDVRSSARRGHTPKCKPTCRGIAP